LKEIKVTETIQMSSIKNQGQGQTQPIPEQNQGLGQFPPFKEICFQNYYWII
jgi:hypothetical protein